MRCTRPHGRKVKAMEEPWLPPSIAKRPSTLVLVTRRAASAIWKTQIS
jgi:hypothetical protein